MINETISVDAGPAIAALDELAAAAAKADEAMAKLKVPAIGGAGGNLGLDKLVAQAEAAAAKIEASFARISEAAKGLGDVGAGGAAGLGKLADAENAAAESADRLRAATTGAADAQKAQADVTKTQVDASKAQADATKAAADANKMAAESSTAAAVAAERQAAATGLTVDAQGKLRDAQGRFVAQDKAMATSAATSEGFFSKHKELILGTGLALGYAVDKAMHFNAEMTLLNTQAGVSTKQMPALTKGVLELAGQVGQSPGNLAESLYHVESNMSSLGIKAPQALKMVKIAAEGASVGHANLVDVTNALTAAVASGIPGVKNYSQAMGVLNTTVGAGDMSMQDLADAFSTGLLATVKGYGATIKDVGAGLATFGDNNIRGAKAGTELRMAVQALAVPASSAKDQLKELGLTTTTLAKDMQSGGMMKALDDLSTRFKQHGINAKNEGEVITTLFGKKAGSGIAVLLEQMDRLKSKYPELTKGANEFGSAWDKTLKTPQQKLNNLIQGTQALAITAGNVLMPYANKALGGLDTGLQWLQQHSLANKGLALGAGALVVGGITKGLFSGVESALQGFGKIGSALKIPGLDKLANIGQNTGLTASASALDGAAASLEGAAASLKGAGVAGAEGGVLGKGAGAAGGEAAAAAEGAGGAAAAGGILGKLGMDFAGLRGAANPIIAGVTAGLMLRGFGDSKAPKGTPAGAMNDELQKGRMGGDPFMNHYLGGLESWFGFSHAGLALGRSFTARAPAPPPSIPAGVTPAFAARFGGAAPVQRTVVAAPAASSATPMLGVGGHEFTVKPKIQPPDTGAISAALANIGNAVKLKPVKMPPPDISALTAAKGKAQSAGNSITQAIESAMKKPAKLPPPDLSAGNAAAGKARGIGASISAGLASGILSQEGAVVAAATAVANAAAAAMAKAAVVRSPSEKTKKTGKGLADGLVVGLQGGQAAVDAAATALGRNAAKATDIAAIDAASKKLLTQVPAGDTALTRMLKADTKDLERMANTRAKLEQEISDSEQVAKNMVSGASVMNALNATNPAGNEPIASSAIITGQGYQASSLKQFAASLKQLQKMGLNATELSQIAQAGPDQGLGIAQGIASGGKDAVKQLNSIQKQIQSSSAQIGNVAGPAMYQAGKDAGAGLAAGLKSELGSLDKAMETLAKSMTQAVDKHAKHTKAAAKKAGAGTASAAASGASDVASASGGTAAKAVAGAGKDHLAAAAGALSQSAAALSSSAAALTGAAQALRHAVGGGGSGSGSGHPGGGSGPHIAPGPGGGGYGGGGHYGTPVYLPPAAGQHVHYHSHVTQHVQGNIHTMTDLVDEMQNAFLNRGINNWQTGIIPPGRAG